MGGLISAYELGGKKDQALIDRARELGNKLSHGWVGQNDLPYNTLDFSTDKPNIGGVRLKTLNFARIVNNYYFPRP